MKLNSEQDARNDIPVDVTFRKRLKLHLFRLSSPGLVL